MPIQKVSSDPAWERGRRGSQQLGLQPDSSETTEVVAIKDFTDDN